MNSGMSSENRFEGVRELTISSRAVAVLQQMYASETAVSVRARKKRETTTN